MPVYDAARDLRATLASVLAQTLRDFELLVVDDGSRDESPAIVASFRDPRIRHLRLDHVGFAAALNRGLDEARGAYVARMDADDLCAPQRLARQVAFMDAHPALGISGTDVETLPARGRPARWRFPTDPERLRAGLLFEPGVAHPTVIARRAWLDRHALRYDAGYARVEDWDLWRRAAEHFPIGNLPEPLLRYRIHDDRMSSRHGAEQRRVGRVIQDEGLARLGLAGDPLRPLHSDVSLADLRCADRGAAFVEDVVAWFERLRGANAEHRVYDAAALDAFLADRLLLVFHQNRALWPRVVGLLARREWLRRSAQWTAVLRLLARGAVSTGRAAPSAGS